MKDQIGNEIKVGSLITYPGRERSALWLNVGRVVEVKEKTVVVARRAQSEFEKDGRLVTIGTGYQGVQAIVVAEPTATA